MSLKWTNSEPEPGELEPEIPFVTVPEADYVYQQKYPGSPHFVWGITLEVPKGETSAVLRLDWLFGLFVKDEAGNEGSSDPIDITFDPPITIYPAP